MRCTVQKLVGSFPQLTSLFLVVFVPLAAEAGTLVEFGQATKWKYLDTGKPPEAGWTGTAFDDAAWKSGPAPLGYGETGLGTKVGWGNSPLKKFITTWFRYSFQKPELKPNERIVLSLRVKDGAVIYLNGIEVTRLNMPAGAVRPETLAPHCVMEEKAGVYSRFRLPNQALQDGRNVMAVEVHLCSAASSALFLDLGLKTAPCGPVLGVREAARPAVAAYNHENYLGPDIRVPNGFVDGGRRMVVDAQDRPHSQREILVVDRSQDPLLARLVAFARSEPVRSLPPLERASRLAERIDQETTPPGGEKWEDKTVEMLEEEFAGQEILIGEWLDQAHAGLCRHRALLFKILGDEAGLKTALIRGNYDDRDGAHTWNELFPGDGRRLLVDIMLMRGKQTFPEVSSNAVSAHYLRDDDSPWYGK